MSSAPHIVIIGASAAGMSALEGARVTNPTASITVITQEASLPYCPTALPYLLSGRITAEAVFSHDLAYFEGQRARFLAGQRVTAVDPPSRHMRLSTGEELGFDRLILAAGASPVVPPVPGVAARGIFGLRTLADARGILEHAKENGTLLVVGAGPVGLEVAAGLRRRGVRVAVVEREDRVMPYTIDRVAASIIEAELVRHGITLYLGCEVKEFHADREGHVVGASLTNGGRVSCGLVLLAVGVRPNTALVEGSRVQCGGGVLVNARMESTEPGLFAAGDIAEAPDFFTGGLTFCPTLPMAVEQGKVAGINAAGGDATFPGAVAMNLVRVFGVQAFSLGKPLGEGETALVEHDPGMRRYRKLVFHDGRLVGAILVNDFIPPGILWGLVRSRRRFNGTVDHFRGRRGAERLWVKATLGSALPR